MIFVVVVKHTIECDKTCILIFVFEYLIKTNFLKTQFSLSVPQYLRYYLILFYSYNFKRKSAVLQTLS